MTGSTLKAHSRTAQRGGKIPPTAPAHKAWVFVEPDPLGQPDLLQEVHQRSKDGLGGVRGTGLAQEPQRGPHIDGVKDLDRRRLLGRCHWIDLHHILKIELELDQRLRTALGAVRTGRGLSDPTSSAQDLADGARWTAAAAPPARQQSARGSTGWLWDQACAATAVGARREWPGSVRSRRERRKDPWAVRGSGPAPHDLGWVGSGSEA
jgi:hypothetical protein